MCIIRTLNEIPIRPIVLLAGDQQQQQPIESIEGKTTQVDSIRYNSSQFRNQVRATVR